MEKQDDLKIDVEDHSIDYVEKISFWGLTEKLSSCKSQHHSSGLFLLWNKKGAQIV